ncbi:glutathione S-transferase A-like [Haliotis rufescens]|uniref:glutathione S-transferase A-like n=1 Tax=Haliotis rufescens TaxID=6454 RepID=UPI00201F1268|nr:glutathione S-transferase A-like [Haliotis rufescens]
MSSNMFLYWGSGSIPCWKPMLVLEEKGLAGYPNKKISFSDKEHKSEEVLKLNPRGQVPTFKDGEIVVNESGAICFYLEHKLSDKGTKLLPDDNAQRARVLQRVFEVSNVDSSIITNLVHYRFRTPKDELDEELLKTKYEAVRTELKKWEDHLAASQGYVVGSNFTMADVFFFPYVAFGVRLGLDISKYPAISAYYDKVKDRPSVKATWPPHWADGPGDSSIMGPV